MTSAQDALSIVAKLEAAGIRATTDVAALNPPAVLVGPPRRTYDVGCGYTATWQLLAVAPAPTAADHVAWGHLDALVDAIAGAFPVETATPTQTVIDGKQLPSYQVTFTATGGE